MASQRKFICRKCGAMHERRNQAVECCMAGDAFSAEELEAIGQRRLFDDGQAAPTLAPLECEPGGPQLRLF